MTDLDASGIDVRAIAQGAKEASGQLAIMSKETRNDILRRIVAVLEQHRAAILAANVADVADARIAVASGALTPALLDRLILDDAKFRAMVDGIHVVVSLDDPIGRLLSRRQLDDGLELHQVTVPLGVIAAIFEARPDAVTQISALALKSGNAVILKAGSESLRTTRAIVQCIRTALASFSSGEHPAPLEGVCLLEGRAAIQTLLAHDDLIDLVVPRGSAALVRTIQAMTRIPVLGHADGICCAYIDRQANIAMAVDIVTDSKMQYPAACNSVETILIHAEIASTVLPSLLSKLAEGGVEVRGCERVGTVVTSLNLPHAIVPATATDWRTEYSALVVACKIVDDLESAISHINTYGSGHTDVIVTNDMGAARCFQSRIDSAGVFHNASTRFADGYRYGLGAEIGVSTGKLHARGPVGLVGLTTYKYLLYGSGQCVASYTGIHARSFSHVQLTEQ